MDFHNRPGSKTGSGGIGTESDANQLRRDRLKKLALETIDLANDPYFLKNHLGTFECKLCLTIHSNEGSYLSHTQGRKHQTNLARRAAKEASQSSSTSLLPSSTVKYAAAKKVVVKIGRPGYKVTKVRSEMNQLGLLFQVSLPEITAHAPQYRFMSSFEQRIEAPSKAHQYLLIAAEPYETIAFKIQSKDIDTHQTISHFDTDTKLYALQIMFK